MLALTASLTTPGVKKKEKRERQSSLVKRQSAPSASRLPTLRDTPHSAQNAQSRWKYVLELNEIISSSYHKSNL